MSERQEKKTRYNQRLEYISAFNKWLNKEPPLWAAFRRRKWKKDRPMWREE